MWSKHDKLAKLGAEPEMAKVNKKRPVKIKNSTSSKKDALIDFLNKRKQPLVVSALVLFSIGPIIVNALFLQTVKHPSPLFMPQPDAKAITAAIPQPREIVLGKDVQKPVSNPLVRDIQRHLLARGYYNTEIDGVMGVRTRAAIGLYQRAFGEVITHDASHSLLQHIRLSNPDPDYHAKVRNRIAEQDKVVVVKNTLNKNRDLTNAENIKKVQRALSQLGYDLEDDGIAGANTKNAIIDFQKKHGLKVDGDLTLVLLNELKKLQLL